VKVSYFAEEIDHVVWAVKELFTLAAQIND